MGQGDVLHVGRGVGQRMPGRDPGTVDLHVPGQQVPAVARALDESPYLSDKSPPVLEYYWSEADRDAWIAKRAERFQHAEPAADEGPAPGEP